VNGSLVASPAYINAHGAPQTLDELLDHEALMQGTETWQLMDGNEVVSVRPQGRFKADNGIALVAAAVAGLGIGYLPLGLTRAHLASGALMVIMPKHPTRPAGAYVVRPPGQHPARKIRVLTEMLTDYFRLFPDFDHNVPVN
jgi:DNA-binding transcriptional LysR family regulator